MGDIDALLDRRALAKSAEELEAIDREIATLPRD
jgi:hypothetical protein